MTINLNTSKTVADDMAKAMASGDETAMATAWQAFGDDIAEQVRKDFRAHVAANDKATLTARGYHTLTTAEERFYTKLSSALKQRRPEQSFIDILSSDDVDDIMPETILEDVMRHLVEERPLLNAVNTYNVGNSTKWIINDNSVQKGGWGQIDSAITDEVTGALKVIDVTQNKYSAFCTVPIDILDMGPIYLDAFVRATLAEAIAYGLEDAIVNGTGVDMPIGITRDPNGTFDQTDGYPVKDAVTVADFTPATYGALVAELATTDNGKTRSVDRVQLVCNTTDYFTKILPATTVLNANGAYVNDLLPYPTDVIPSPVCEEGTAVLGILPDYTLAVGGSKNGVIEYDDSIGFLDHTRTFRVVQHAAGRAYDSSSFITLDVSSIDPAYITVKSATDTVTA